MHETLRVDRSKEAARKIYNRLGRHYDWLAGGNEDTYRRMGLRWLGASTGETILEIGYGTGRSVLDLAIAVGDSGRVLGLDISDRMQELALTRIRRAGLQARVKLDRADALVLPCPGESIDAVFFCFTLELFDTPELNPILRECWRVLKQSGRICVVAMSKLGKQGLMSRLYGWAHDTFPKQVDCRPIPAEELLKGAGFRTLEASIHRMWGLPIEIVLSRKAET